MRVEPTGDGFLIHHDQGFVHLTAEWADAIHRDQFAIHGHQNPSLNKLRYHLAHGDPTVDQVEEWFTDFYGEIRKNRKDRENLGLKAVTRHGHEDLEAVRNGEPVRPWNAAKPERSAEFEDFIRRARENR